jgi:hypothetical protein
MENKNTIELTDEELRYLVLLLGAQSIEVYHVLHNGLDRHEFPRGLRPPVDIEGCGDIDKSILSKLNKEDGK